MRRFTILLYPEDGGYSVLVPVLGVATQGETIDEAMAMARDLIEVTVQGLIEDNQPIPEEETPPMISTVDITLPIEVTV